MMNQLSRLRLVVLLILNIAGIFVATYSLYFTERLNSSVFPARLICDINNVVSCSTTYMTEYAYILNVPVSFLVLLFFWFVVSTLLINKRSTGLDRIMQLLSLINAAALIVCLIFLCILLFILKGVCISCLLIDFIVIMNFFILFRYLKVYFSSGPVVPIDLIRECRSSILSLILLFATGLGLFKAYQVMVSSNNRELLSAFQEQAPMNDRIYGSTILYGNSNPEVKILIFNDFLCSYCKIASKRYREIVGEENRSIGIEFVCHPLDYEKKINNGHFDMSIFVTKVMLAARDDVNFWPFHDHVISRVNELDSTGIFKIAEGDLFNYGGFKDTFFHGNIDSLIKTNIDFSDRYRVRGTPTIFINGRELQQWSNLKLLRMILPKH